MYKKWIKILILLVKSIKMNDHKKVKKVGKEKRKKKYKKKEKYKLKGKFNNKQVRKVLKLRSQTRS